MCYKNLPLHLHFLIRKKIKPKEVSQNSILNSDIATRGFFSFHMARRKGRKESEKVLAQGVKNYLITRKMNYFMGTHQ